MSGKKPLTDKPDLPVDPERGDAIMRAAFKMAPKSNKEIKPKKRGKARRRRER
jgi:hypothetical protein